MTWVVDTEVINPYGICLGEGLPREDYRPYVDIAGTVTGRIRDDSLYFESFQGLTNSRGDPVATYVWRLPLKRLGEDYFRREYNLSDDIELDVDVRRPWCNGCHNSVLPLLDAGSYGTQRTFETEAEALEYVDTLGNPDRLMTIIGDNTFGYSNLFSATWRVQVDGIWIDRDVDLTYTGDELTLYTINDLVDFLALFLGMTSEEVWNTVELSSDSSSVNLDNPPTFDCEPYIKATVIDVDGPAGNVEINIDFTGSSIPGDATVTVIDGDPPATELENGVGSITISDAGNISMLNDGGTFFLNEFGNVGFYANGDASLTADNQVQLGSGGTTFNVDSNGLNMRDSTGTVSFTADELSRLKDLLS